MIPTPEQAYALVCDYNEGEFHRKHARIVGDVMRWYANELAMVPKRISGRPWASCMIWTLSSGRNSTAPKSRS